VDSNSFFIHSLTHSCTFRNILHQRNKESDRKLPVINVDNVAFTAVEFLREVMQHGAFCERLVVLQARSYLDLFFL